MKRMREGLVMCMGLSGDGGDTGRGRPERHAWLERELEIKAQK